MAGRRLACRQQQFIYFVWVSEVMSQQTQVVRAAEYFRRWVEVHAPACVPGTQLLRSCTRSIAHH